MKKIAEFSTARGAEPRGRAERDNPLPTCAKGQPFSGADAARATRLVDDGDTAGFVAPREVSCRGPDELERLFAALGQAGPENNPRTFKLVESSNRKIAQKVIEEAGEVALEAVKHHASGVVRESADLLYHLVVLWRRAGIEPVEIWEEMRTRADVLGIAEKRPKALARKTTIANSNR
jgi:phosphoribosyl-ATP pyrophosphohydrolase